VRGCIVGPDLSVLNLIVVKRGENAVAGLTDSQIPRRLGPKRANKVRKLFNLSKEDDVTKYVIARKFENKKGKSITKRPKIQRLVTPLTVQVGQSSVPSQSPGTLALWLHCSCTSSVGRGDMCATEGGLRLCRAWVWAGRRVVEDPARAPSKLR